MTDFVFGAFFGAAMAAVATAYGLRELDRRYWRPFRWSCQRPGCRFRAAGTDAAFVAAHANRHQARGEHT